jgi:hypothetical protein
MNVKFDPSGSAGFMRAWLNGALLVEHKGGVGYAGSNGNYWKFGGYRSVAPEYFGVRYANMRIGTADLSDKITNPDPIPDGYCYCIR